MSTPAPTGKPAKPPIRTHCDFAYVIQSTDDNLIVKVGRSAQPGLRSAVPFPMRLITYLSDGMKREREMKALMAHCKIRGEWFRPAKELNDYLSDAYSAGAIMERHAVNEAYVISNVVPVVENYLAGRRVAINDYGHLVFRFLSEPFYIFPTEKTKLIHACPQFVSPELIYGYVPALAGGSPPQIALLTDEHATAPHSESNAA